MIPRATYARTALLFSAGLLAAQASPPAAVVEVTATLRRRY